MGHTVFSQVIALFIIPLIHNEARDIRRYKTQEPISKYDVTQSLLAIIHEIEEYVKEIYGDEILDTDQSKDITPEIDSLAPLNDRNAYLLYHALRTTEEREHIDPEAARTLNHTKAVLHEALRTRCNKLKSCVKQCPKKKIYLSCTVKCQETYDDYNVCEEKKSCAKPKCGRTKPPSWLLLRN